MYLDVEHLSHFTDQFTFIRRLQVSEDEFVCDTTAKFEVTTLWMGDLE